MFQLSLYHFGKIWQKKDMVITKHIQLDFMMRIWIVMVLKAYDKVKHNFGSLNEFMARMCYDGAIAISGDEDLNKAFNYSEIRKVLKRFENEKDNEKDFLKFLKMQLLAEIKVNQGLLNYIIRLLLASEQTSAYWINADENKFTSLIESELNLLRNKMLLEVHNE